MRQNETYYFLKYLIADIRRDHPTLSCRAIFYKIHPENMGRDKFERFCYEAGFMIERKTNYARTTDSSGVIRFDNLLEGLILTDINQAFSSDITYFEIAGKFYYITFVIDCFSRRILGHTASWRLTTEQTTLPALKKAIITRKYEIRKGIVFHSDGGGQYYDKEFMSLTAKYHFKNSMCEMAYENGKAERVNGIIKNNYLKHCQIKTFDDLTKILDRSVSLYNNDRPHKSLKYKTPVNFEKELLYLKQQNKPKMKESFDG